MKRWKEIQLVSTGVISTVILMAIGGAAFAWSGLFDVSASVPHAPLVGKIVHRTMIESVRRHARKASIPNFSSADVQAGFCEYREHCEMCHGAPAIGRPTWVNGMNPAPPYLIDARTRWNRAEIFWIVRNGIKMTAMPAWRDSMTDREIWNVAGFLEALPKLPPPAYADLASRSACMPANAETKSIVPQSSLPTAVRSQGPVNMLEEGPE